MNLYLKTYTIADCSLSIFIPDGEETKRLYSEGKIPFPYWSQVWPSAIALSEYIMQHPELIPNKKVLEVAAGLGLPSMFAARHASEVICSDYNEDAVAIMEKTIRHLQLKNCSAMVLDWNNLPGDLEADVVLLSDINYNPEAFSALKNMILHFLQKGSTLILASPQRLMAKQFIEEIVPFAFSSEDRIVDSVVITVFLLRKIY